jgi:RHS repeat-associated protein
MATTRFFWDDLDDNIVEEFDDAGNSLVDYTHEPGRHGSLISEAREGVSRQYHFDAGGNVLAMTDASEQVTDTFSYRAFGEVAERTGATPTPFQFKGAEGLFRDDLTSEYLARTRYISSALGRWLSADPLLLADGPNAYAFVGNNPIAYSDPTGLIKVVTTFESSELKCNKSLPEGNFTFSVEFKDKNGKLGAPCAGFIVQKVSVTCYRKLCSKCEPCELPDEKKFNKYEYWEAWFIKKGDSDAPDTAGRLPTWDDSCGVYEQRGEIKFYCMVETAVPRGAGDRVGTGDLRKLWTERNFGGKTLCATTSGELPATSDPEKAKFWDKKSIEASGSRASSLKWNCCEDKSTVTFDVKPKKE